VGFQLGALIAAATLPVRRFQTEIEHVGEMMDGWPKDQVNILGLSTVAEPIIWRALGVRWGRRGLSTRHHNIYMRFTGYFKH